MRRLVAIAASASIPDRGAGAGVSALAVPVPAAPVVRSIHSDALQQQVHAGRALLTNFDPNYFSPGRRSYPRTRSILRHWKPREDL